MVVGMVLVVSGIVLVVVGPFPGASTSDDSRHG